jgi:hypothetical protein
MDTGITFGAPFKPLAGLIEPISVQPDTPQETQEPPKKHIKHTSGNTKIEKIFIYLAILLCIALLTCILYWIFSNYLFYSILLVLVATILYTLLYIAEFRDYLEDTTTHKKITSIGTLVILVMSTLMLLVVVRNKRRFM